MLNDLNQADSSRERVSELGAARPASGPTPWSLPDLAFFLAFAFLWLLTSNFLALAAYAELRPILGWQTTWPELQNNAYFAIAAQTLFYGPLLAYIYALVAIHYRLPFWAGLHWRNPAPRQAVRIFVSGILLAYAVRYAPPLLPDKETFPLERLFTTPQAAYAVGAFAVLVAPLMEELIFRGLLFAFIEYKFRLWPAISVTATLFAALHVPEYWGAWNHVFLIFLVGLVFSLARGLTGSLAPSVILHLAYNTGQMAQLFLEKQF